MFLRDIVMRKWTLKFFLKENCAYTEHYFNLISKMYHLLFAASFTMPILSYSPSFFFKPYLLFVDVASLLASYSGTISCTWSFISFSCGCFQGSRKFTSCRTKRVCGHLCGRPRSGRPHDIRDESRGD